MLGKSFLCKGKLLYEGNNLLGLNQMSVVLLFAPEFNLVETTCVLCYSR